MNSMQKCLILFVTICASCVFNRSVWAEGPLDLELQLKAGDPVQGVEGQIWRILEVSSGQPGNTVLRVGLRQLGGSYREVVVLKTSEGLRKIIAEGEPLPGGAGTLTLSDYSGSYLDSPFIQMNSRGAVALIVRQGIFLYQEGVLEALAVKGQAVPGTGSSIDSFLSVTSEFWGYWHNLHGPYASSLSSNGQIVFAAALSDGRNGVFLASRQAIVPVLLGGDAVPDRQGVKLRPDVVPLRAILKGDHLTIVISDEALGFGVFHYTTGRLSTVVLGTDNIGGRGTLDYLASCDGNEKGTVALGINLRQNDEATGPAELLLWSATLGITKLLDASTELPGIENHPWRFMFVSLDPEDRLVFAAEGATGFGFYFWEKGNVEKIVAEGDPAPEGGAFHLEQDVAIPIPGRPGPRLYAVSPTNGRKEVAFMASSTAGGIRRPFLWSHGALLPMPVGPLDLPGFGGRPVTSASTLQLTSDGRLLVSAEGCCDHFHALYATLPAFPRMTFLPFLAAGSIPGYSYSSAIQLANRSHYTGHVLVEIFQETGQAEEARDVVIEPGELASISLADMPFRRGYARVTTNGGAAVQAEVLIRARHEENDFDLIVPTTLATTKNDFVLDGKSQNTAVAVANPGSDSARITVRLFNRNRRLLATEYLSLAPHEQSSFLVTDLFGSAAGGDRRLRLESSSAFLAASFSLNGFRFTSLPEVPISSQGSPPWSLVNLYPGEVQEVTASARGTIAFATKEGRLMVVRDGIVSEVPNVIPRPDNQTRGVMLPKSGTSGDSYLTRIVGFREVNGKEEVLFICYPLQGAVRLLGWDGEELRTVIELGKPLHLETGQTLYPALEIAELNRKGDLLIAAMEVDDTFKSIGMWFLVHDGASLRPLFSIPPPAQFPSVAFNSSDQVALITVQYPEKKALGFFDGQKYRTIAEVGSQRLVDWWRATDFMQIGLSEDGTTFFAADVRQTTETPRTGILAAKNGVIRPVLIGSVSPQYSLAAVQSPFQVNSRGKLAFETRLATASNSYGSAAFLIVENTTLQTTLVAVQDVSVDVSYTPGFQWTDNDELFVSARDLRFPESILYSWKEGVWTTVLDGSQSLVNTPGAVVSPSSWHSRIWPAAGFDSPIITIYSYDAHDAHANDGLYVGVRRGVRQLFFPQVVGESKESSPIADLMVTNEGKEPAKVRLRAPDGNGGAYFAVEALLASKEDRSIGISADQPFVGWLAAEAIGGNVDARLGLSLFEGTSDYVRLAVPFAIPKRESFTTTPPASFGELGLAFANPYSRGAEITVELLKSEMEVERQEKMQIGPQGQKSIYVTELFGTQLPGRLLRIRSDLPIATFAAVQSKRGVAVQPVF